MNTAQFGSILNRLTAQEEPQRRIFSNEGRRRRISRPLKRSLRGGILVLPYQLATEYSAGKGTIGDLKGGELDSRSKSNPSVSTSAGSKKKRLRSSYTPERVKRNS